MGSHLIQSKRHHRRWGTSLRMMVTWPESEVIAQARLLSLPKLKSIGRRFGRREDLCTPSLHAQDAFSTEYKIPCRRVIESLPIVRLLSGRPVRSKERREQRRARIRDTTQQRATATRGRGEIRPPILATLSALSLSRARGGRAPRPDPRDPSSDDLLSGGKPAGLRLTVASLARAFFAPRALSHTV